MAQWVRASAFGSGHGLRVLGSSPASGSLLSRVSASLSLCLPLCLLVISLSLCQINKIFEKIKIKDIIQHVVCVYVYGFLYSV